MIFSKFEVVTESRKYPVIVGLNLLIRIGEMLEERLERVFIICDDEVSNLYLASLIEGLERSGIDAITKIIPSGESSKTLTSVEILYNFLTDNTATRSDTIIALGGGVVGDIAGFVASTFKRGMRLIQLPTTLLAQTDSAIGGKTGLNLKDGKNLVGTFYQPHAVIIDIETLSSLPITDFIGGLAEVIKYAFTMDPELFEILIEKEKEILQREPEVISVIVERALRNKAKVVEVDEREEQGRREILNFGHTVGHAIEVCTNHSILHGQAVAIGMVEEAKLAVGRGLLVKSVLESLIHILTLFGLPTELPNNVDFNQLQRIMKQDKKVRDGQLTIPMLVGLGKTKMIVNTVDILNFEGDTTLC
ncbi:MAG: 3-dehydroquinate synthase [Candidatus Thorarchaeota archaeon]